MMRKLTIAIVLLAVGVTFNPTRVSGEQPQPAHRVKSVEIKILSTMLADDGFGEWGFAALVEVDGRRILFDTGANEDTVARNLKVLGLSLADVDTVILSHNHGDHTTGLVTLRRSSHRRHRHASHRLCRERDFLAAHCHQRRRERSHECGGKD